MGLTRTPCLPAGRGVIHLPSPMKSIDLMNFSIHSSCVHNHIDALTRRVAMCVPQIKDPSYRRLLSLSKLLGKRIGLVQPISRAEVIGMFGGFRRRRYEKADEKLRVEGEFIDSRVKMFVKQEAVHIKASKVNPACRAIQFREPTYSLQLAQYIKPIEHVLYRVTGPKPFPLTPFIAKNLNQKQRASLIKQKFESMPGCTMLELDASRFDAHVSARLLQVEHACYTSANGDKHFAKLLKEQLLNRGRCKGDGFSLSYSLRGGRMSGDMNTASGNCILMSCMLAAYGQDNCKQYDFLVDGDDSVFFFIGSRPTEAQIYDYFLQFGMEMKVDNITTELSALSFCQGKIVELGSGPTMVRNPIKVLSRTTLNVKFSDLHGIPLLLKTISLGELSLVRGCPVLQEYFLALIRVAEKHMSRRGKKSGVIRGRDWADYRLKRDMPGDWYRLDVQPITMASRESFAKSWDMGIDQQMILEARFRDFNCDLSSIPIPGTGVDVSRWFYDAFIRECSL